MAITVAALVVGSCCIPIYPVAKLATKFSSILLFIVCI